MQCPLEILRHDAIGIFRDAVHAVSSAGLVGTVVRREEDTFVVTDPRTQVRDRSRNLLIGPIEPKLSYHSGCEKGRLDRFV